MQKLFFVDEEYSCRRQLTQLDFQYQRDDINRSRFIVFPPCFRIAERQERFSFAEMKEKLIPPSPLLDRTALLRKQIQIYIHIRMYITNA